MSNPLDAALSPVETVKSNPLDDALNPLDISLNGPLPPSSNVSKGSGAVSGYLTGIEDFAKNIGGLASGAAGLLSDPSQIPSVVGEGVSTAVGQLQHPVDLVKGIVWDGILKPVVYNNARLLFDKGLTPEEKFDLGRESSLAITGLAIGEGVGRVIGMVGKGAAASRTLKALAEAKGVEGITESLVNTLSPQEALTVKALTETAMKDKTFLKSSFRAASINAGAGFGMGVAQSNDPSIALKQGIVNGIAGALMGPVFHSFSSGSTKGLGAVRNYAYERSRDAMVSDLLQSAPEHTLNELIKGTDPVRIAAMHMPDGMGHILSDVPSEVDVTKMDNVFEHTASDGSKSYMILGRNIKVGDKVINPTYLDLPVTKGKKIYDMNSPPSPEVAKILAETGPLSSGYNSDDTTQFKDRMAAAGYDGIVYPASPYNGKIEFQPLSTSLDHPDAIALNGAALHEYPALAKLKNPLVDDKVSVEDFVKKADGLAKEYRERAQEADPSVSWLLEATADRYALYASRAKEDGINSVTQKMLNLLSQDIKSTLEDFGYDSLIRKGEYEITFFNLNKFSFLASGAVDYKYKKVLEPVDPSIVKHFEQYGYIPDQVVSIKGVDHRIEGFSGKEHVNVQNLTTGEVRRLHIDRLPKNSERLQQAKFISYENALKLSATDLAATHFAMGKWLEDASAAINRGETVDLKTAPPFGLVRWQQSGSYKYDWTHIIGQRLAEEEYNGKTQEIIGQAGNIITPEMAQKLADAKITNIATQHPDYKYGKDHFAQKVPIPYPDEPQYSLTRENTYYNLADAEGKNASYEKPTSAHPDEYTEGGDKEFKVMVTLKNPLFLLGDNGNSGHTGRAIIAKLKPEWADWQWDIHLNAIRAFLKPRMTPEQITFFESKIREGDFVGWDRIGSELAKDAGYTEVLNIPNLNYLESAGNEFVKLELPSAYKELKAPIITKNPLELKLYDEEVLKKQYPEMVKESPEDAVVYEQNKNEMNDKDYNAAKETAASFASANMFAQRNASGAIDVSDASGMRIQTFADLKDAMEFAKAHGESGGDILIPGTPGVKTVGFDDSGSFALNQKRNLVNALRDWLATGASLFTTPYSYFSSLEGKFGRRYFNDFFLPLQHARTAYNLRMKGLADKINPVISQIATLNPDRRGHVSNAVEAFSPSEMLSDKPSILSRTLTDHEKRIGQDLATNSTHADRVTAYQFIRQEKALKESLKGVSKEESLRLYQDFLNSNPLSDVQKTVVKFFEEIKKESIDDISLYAVNRLADGIESKSLSRVDYMDLHKFTKSEREIVTEIEKVYATLADDFGIDKGSRLGGYITHAVEYDGKVLDGSVITNSRYLPAKTRDFIYAAVRTGEMQDLIRDPGELLKKYVTQGARTETLYPALTQAKTFLQTALVGMDKGSAEAINRRATDYMNQIIGAVDPRDALVSADVINKAEGAFINALQKVGVNSDTANKWLRIYFKTSELATQGFKPLAGLRDATSTLMYWYARFGAKRLGTMLSDWNLATATKGILQEQGKIPGLTVEFFTGMDGALVNKSFLDKAAESGFKFSGQPYVYQQFHAMAYINTVKTVLSAASDLEAKRITQRQFEKRVGLSTYDLPQAKRFTELLRHQPSEAASYLADITGREVVGYYGMANHPFFMSSRAGKVLGQHGQWPLWMVQNFGRLASQGSRSQRLLTAAKMGAMFAAIKYGGQAAGFNLGNWTFSPDNAIFTGGPAVQTGFWAATYFGSNDPSQREFASRMLERANLLDPNGLSRSQYFLPIPAQFYNIGWGMARLNNGDPLHVVGAQFMGLPIDQHQYPK